MTGAPLLKVKSPEPNDVSSYCFFGFFERGLSGARKAAGSGEPGSLSKQDKPKIGQEKKV